MSALWTQISGVWSGISTFIVDQVEALQEMFWNSTTSTLTFMGTLATIGVGVGVILLLVGIIQSFLGLRH